MLRDVTRVGSWWVGDAGGGEGDSADFEDVGGGRGLVGGVVVAAEEFGQRVGVLGGGGGGADDVAAVEIGAFADGEDTGVGGLQVIVDEDAAVAVQAPPPAAGGSTGEFFVGQCAGGEDEEVAGDFRVLIFDFRLIERGGIEGGGEGGGAMGLDSGCMDVVCADEFHESRVKEDADAAEGEFFGQVGAGDRVELFAHQAVGAQEEGDVAAAGAEGIGEFHTQEAAAVDDGVLGRGRKRRHDLVGILARAEREDAGLRMKPVVMDRGCGSRGKDEDVVGKGAARGSR